MALAALTEHRATFTREDLAKFIARNTDGAEQFARVLAKVSGHPDVVQVGKDAAGKERFSTAEMVAVEQRLAADARALDARRERGVATLGHAEGLGQEQVAALEHVAAAGNLKLVVGYAGTGKSKMLGAAKMAWQAAGSRVYGAALSGMAAEALQQGSGIASRTLASMEWRWARGQDALRRGDVLVVDEAGLVGSRQLARVTEIVRAAGAKLVLVGDGEQLQAIQAGAAFAALHQRYGAVMLTKVRRQHGGWMRAATAELATGRTREAIARYHAAGMVHASDSSESAQAALIAQWAEDMRAKPDRTSLILAPTRADVAALNTMAREAAREIGILKGKDVMLRLERGQRAVAVGERIAFLRNDPTLGVRNGSMGVVREVANGKLTVQLDAGRQRGAGAVISFDPAKYGAVEHGYAMTMHKSQGQTFDSAQVLAGPTMDRHSAYVALSRHSDRVDIHHSFKDEKKLADAISQDGRKDSTLDYASGGRMESAVAAVAQRIRAARQQQKTAATQRAVKKVAQQRARGRGLSL